MMNKIRVMTIFGTRPEAVKMAPVILELRRRPEIEPIVCVTAQHREMLDQVLDIFGIAPDYDLNIMQQSQTLSSITTRALTRLDEALEKAKPDIILVHGDTSTTFAGALSAFYHHIKVGHVEAGLRTWDKYSPFPEEMNRQLVGRIADLHFCPTRQNRENLARENVKDGVFLTGNTAIDTVKLIAREPYTFKTPLLNGIDFENRRVLLMTAHRRENYGEPLHNIMRAVKELLARYPDLEVVYPVHPSPAVRETAFAELGDNPRAHLIDPLPIDDNLNLMKRCRFVLTDSGGIQEEAPALGRPVLVMRRETERPEAVQAGTAALAGVEQADIVRMASALLDDPAEYARMAHAVNPYGDGYAARRIAQAILFAFGAGDRPEEFRS